MSDSPSLLTSNPLRKSSHRELPCHVEDTLAWWVFHFHLVGTPRLPVRMAWTESSRSPGNELHKGIPPMTCRQDLQVYNIFHEILTEFFVCADKLAVEEKNHEQVMPCLHRIVYLGEVNTHTLLYGDTKERKTKVSRRTRGKEASQNPEPQHTKGLRRGRKVTEFVSY